MGTIAEYLEELERTAQAFEGDLFAGEPKERLSRRRDTSKRVATEEQFRVPLSTPWRPWDDEEPAEAEPSKPSKPTLAGLAPEAGGIPYCEWMAGQMNRIFAELGTAGPSRIKPATVQAGLDKEARRP